jgi:hypothetical protein
MIWSKGISAFDEWKQAGIKQAGITYQVLLIDVISYPQVQQSYLPAKLSFIDSKAKKYLKTKHH